MKKSLPVLAAISVFCLFSFSLIYAQDAASSDGKEWQNAGGKFTDAEVQATLAKFPKELEYGVQHMGVRLRDGVELATTVFSPKGEGKWPTVYVCTPYGRKGGATKFPSVPSGSPFVCVVQDARGTGDSGGKPLADYISSENEIADTSDTIDWIAKQPWSNGRVGMTGGSGHGMAAAMAYYSKNPHLVVVRPDNSAGNTYLYWSFENGVRRKTYEWLTNRGMRKNDWPKPTLYSYDEQRWNKICDAATNNPTVYIGNDKWFNFFGDSALDFFEKFAPTGKVFLGVDAGAHGGHCDKGLKFKIKGPTTPAAPVPSFLDVLTGKSKPEKSQLVYSVLGDAGDPTAPGNIKKVVSSWPPASSPTKFYLTAQGGLTEKPAVAEGKREFAYDPAKPAPSLGGGWSFGNDPNGAVDQRPTAERADVLRFYSEPLAEPLEIAGKIKADLFVSTDATDTTFVVKLVDVYPDGQEILLREGIAMARYRNGLDKPSPVEVGKVFEMSFPCNSIAAVFNKGHKIGVFVTSSSSPSYEVHPNTYEPVSSPQGFKVANQTVYCSPKEASCVILPVVK